MTAPDAVRGVRPLFHGGQAGLAVGDTIRPGRQHMPDGCPICVARAQGLSFTVGAYRVWLADLLRRWEARPGGAPDQIREAAAEALEVLAGVPGDAPVDPPSAYPDRVYLAADRAYARWYAARSGHGDLYRVWPAPPVEPADEDPGWECYTAPSAVVVEVLERDVHLTMAERRGLFAEWTARDRLAGA